jgi:ABC-2 type transport system ATP-binding protein
MSEKVIEIKNLTKKYGAFAALRGFNMTVEKGKIHGFLGPNGAGKSTTIRTILGLQKKTSGEITLFGADPWRNATELHARLAYVPGDVNFWPNLTGGEIIDLLGKLRGGLNEKRRAELLAKFELDPTKKFRTYSKGNRQKVALIAALSSDVELYIFDEPTSGLDPLMEQIFQDEVREISRKGKTVLLSSHILSEAEALCDEVTIIREGQNAGDYTLAELKKEHGNLEKIFLEKYAETKSDAEEM